MVNRLNPRPGWILKDSDMLGMYDKVWVNIIHSTKINNIITCITMNLWKILYSIWDSKIIVVDTYGIFKGI